MSCGCNGGDSEYNNLCNADIPYPQISSESVPSLINNLTLALYGSYTKSVNQATGRIVWDVPCTPETSPIGGLAPIDGEGMLCYVARALNTLFPSTEPFVTLGGVQTLSNKTLDSPVLIGPLSINDSMFVGNLLNVNGIASFTVGIKSGTWPIVPLNDLLGIVSYGSISNSTLAVNRSGDVGLGDSLRSSGSQFKARAHIINKSSLGGFPLSSGSLRDPNCIMRVEGATSVLDFGFYGSSGANAAWIQPRTESNYALPKNINICPTGGNVGIGNSNPQQKLDVAGSVNVSNALQCYSILSDVIISNGSIKASGGVFVYGGVSGIDIDGDPSDLTITTPVDFNGNRTYGSPQIAKCWLNATLNNTSAPTVNAASGMSITRSAVGTFTVSFTDPLSSANYCALVTTNRVSTTSPISSNITSRQTNQFTLSIYASNVVSDLSSTEVNIVVFAN